MKLGIEDPYERRIFAEAMRAVVAAFAFGIAVGLVIAGAPERWQIIALAATIVLAFGGELVTNRVGSPE